MPRELFELELDELSLVDRPCNQEAKVSLFKRENPQEDNMEQLQEQINALKADLAKRDETITAQTAEVERLTKALKDAEFDVTPDAITKRATVEEIEIEGVKVNKADIPAPVLKALETAAIEKADVALTKRAETELPNFKVDVAKSLLKAVGEDAEALKALKSADKLFAKMQEEVGETKTDADMADAEAKLEKMAKNYAATNNVSYFKAYDLVTKSAEGLELVKQIYKKD